MRHLSILSLLCACTGENVLEKQQNIAPTITIQSHSDGAEILEGYLESFRAQVSDDDNNFDELEIAWFVGEEEACAWDVASLAGESFCDIVFVPADSAVVAEVRDAQGAGGRDEISITVTETEAPVIEILSPTQTDNYYANQLIEFSALISDREEEVSALMIAWSSSIDGELSLRTEADTSGEISDYTYLSEGQHAIALRVEDSSQKVTTESVVITVGGDNSDPLCEITEPQSGSAYVIGQNISFSGTAVDNDINNSLLRVTWESNQDGPFDSTAANSTGALIFVYNGLSAGNHTITLRVEDEVGGLCTDTALLAIGTPPILTLTTPISGDVVTFGDAVLFTATVSDQEDIPSDVIVAWVSDIDGEFAIQSSDSNGNISFISSSFTAGEHNLTITATDSAGLTATTSLTLRINTPPTTPTISISPATANSNDSLTVTASGSSDADGDAITYQYAWYLDGVLTSNTTPSVPSSDTSPGEVWTVRVTANDGYIDGAFVEESSTIINLAPVLTPVSISPNIGVTTGVTLSCLTIATDPDDGILIPTYEWTVGTAILGAGNTYTVSSVNTNVGDSIVCTATAVDFNGETTSGAASVTIDNTDPVLSNTIITPNTNVYIDTILTCSATVTDPDEMVSISYTWMISGSPVGWVNTLDLSTTSTIYGDLVTCEATVIDSHGASDSQSNTVTIDNRAPSVAVVSISPGNPIEAVDDLLCSASGSTDDDGQSVTYFYAWTSDSGATVSGDIVSALLTTAGEIWECTVTPNDGIHDGLSSTASVTINSNCPSMSASIYTQTDADSFIPCTELDNIYLHITSGVVTVDLPNLVTVYDSIYFHMNNDLETVYLPLLETVGSDFYFHQNLALVSIETPALQSVDEYLYFSGNSLLSSLDMTNTLTYVGDYTYFSNNPLLCVPNLNWSAIAQNYHYDNGNLGCN